MNAWWVREIRGVGLTLTLSCSLLGCNPAPPPSFPRETVRGKVTYKGKPLPGGFVLFYNGTNRVGVGAIKRDGSGVYEACVPAGPVQVIVKGDLRPDRIGMPTERSSRLRLVRRLPPRRSGLVLDAKQEELLDEIQKKYGSLRTDKPLTFLVGAGEQTWNINLD
jgi:hypothetical protein